jgi:hypothetical protein
MSAAARGIIVLVAGLLLGAGAGSTGTTLYVNRVVLAEPGNVTLAALVRTSAPLSAAAQQAMSSSVTVLGDTVQYLPVSQYAPQLEAAFGTDAIIVGSWSLVVPRGTSAEAEPYLLDRLTDFLVAQNLLGDNRAELSFMLGNLSGPAPRDGSPAFQVTKTPRGTEVSFQLSGSGGSSVTGRVALPAAASSPDAAAAALKANSAVRVLFRKGPITVEMPGRLTAGAAIGQAVTVLVSDSQKTFTGRVLDGKVVQVDLP